MSPKLLVQAVVSIMKVQSLSSVVSIIKVKSISSVVSVLPVLSAVPDLFYFMKK